jgi:hypothetical protein
MPSSGNSDDIIESKIQVPPASDHALSHVGICPEQVSFIDRLCRLAEELSAVSAGVRNAIDQDSRDDLTGLRQEFDRIREEIIHEVRGLWQHRLEHRCQK